MSDDGRLFIFDLDNTLVPNQQLYEEAKYGLGEEVAEELGPDAYEDPAAFADMLDDIDAELYDERGVTETRFRDACVKAVYRAAAEPDADTGEADMAYLRDRAEDLGMLPFGDYTYLEMLDGAAEALEYVQEQGDDVAVMTKGIDDAQQRKLAQIGLDRFEALVVDDKDAEAFAELTEGYDDADVWKIGDSMRSDIRPAVENGYGAVHVDADNWKGEDAADPSADERWFRIPDLTRFEEAYTAIEEFDETRDPAALGL